MAGSGIPLMDASLCTGQIICHYCSPKHAGGEVRMTWEGGPLACIDYELWPYMSELLFIDALPWPCEVVGDDLFRRLIVIRRKDMA